MWFRRSQRGSRGVSSTDTFSGASAFRSEARERHPAQAMLTHVSARRNAGRGTKPRRLRPCEMSFMGSPSTGRLVVGLLQSELFPTIVFMYTIRAKTTKTKDKMYPPASERSYGTC